MKSIQEEITFPNLSIVSEPLSWYFRVFFLLKKWLKKLLFAQSYGPKSVLESILKWLEEIPNIKWNHNPDEKDIYKSVYVPVGVEALKYALSLKHIGKIQKLIVGPNITIPTSKNDIFFDKWIDIIVVPSHWLREYFYSLLGFHDPRIIIVPAGVDNAEPHSKKTQKILIYKKNCPEELFQSICEYLEKNNYEYSLFLYGKFQKQDFLDALRVSQCLIYLQTSESQWIALHEAWMRDVPTLVWNQGYWKYAGMIWRDSHISAPYLTDDCGMFFSSKYDFPEVFRLFFERLSLYSPRKYCLENFTHIGALGRLLRHLL